MKKTPQNTTSERQQTPRVVSEEPRRGLKTPSERLRRLIEMANLLGDYELPSRGEDKFSWNSASDLLSAVIDVRPDSLRLHLLDLLNDPEQWRWSPADLIRDGFKPEFAQLHCQAQAVTERYRFIRGAAGILQTVVSGERLFPAAVFIERRPPDNEGREIAAFVGGDLAEPLIGVDLRYIKRCEVCKRFFFAGRINSDACTPATCGRILQKRRERARTKDKAKRRKKKRAEANV